MKQSRKILVAVAIAVLSLTGLVSGASAAEVQTDNGYEFEYLIGQGSRYNASKVRSSIMNNLENNFRTTFVTPSNCTKIKVGSECNLSTGSRYLKAPVRVTGLTSTSLSLVSLPGHVEGAGNKITFTFVIPEGNSNRLLLNVRTSGPYDSPLFFSQFARSANRGAVAALWKGFATKLGTVHNPVACTLRFFC